MKKKVIISLILVVILNIFFTITFSQQQFDFGKINWGMSVEQVKEINNLDKDIELDRDYPITPFFTVPKKKYDPDKKYPLNVTYCWTIEAGTFSDETDAHNLAKKISDKGYQTYIVSENSNYIVQVGEFENLEEARSFSESDKLIEITGYGIVDRALSYKVDVISKNYTCDYYFKKDKLGRVCYAPSEKYSDENDYIRDYEKIKKILIEKYGKLDEKKLLDLTGSGEMYWKYDFYKDDKSKWGLAVSKGDLEYFARWETNNTLIYLHLKGSSIPELIGSIYLSVYFFPNTKENKDLEKKSFEERAKS